MLNEEQRQGVLGRLAINQNTYGKRVVELERKYAVDLKMYYGREHTGDEGATQRLQEELILDHTNLCKIPIDELPTNLTPGLAEDITNDLTDGKSKTKVGSSVARILKDKLVILNEGTDIIFYDLSWIVGRRGQNLQESVPNLFLGDNEECFFETEEFRTNTKAERIVFRRLVDLTLAYLKNDLGIKPTETEFSYCPFYTSSGHKRKTNLEDTLIEQGINPQDAELVSKKVDAVVECKPTEVISKNVVYYVTDKLGNKKIVKIVRDKEEAEIEALVNYNFSKHPVLKLYLPQGLIEKPLETKVGEETRYVLLQEDVSQLASKKLDSLLKQGRQGIQTYLGYWMKNLAALHVYGTEVMDYLGNTKKAQSITKERDQERILTSHLKIDKSLRDELIAEGFLEGNVFIHQDLRLDNRLGEYALDWGHSGRGNQYLDIARVLIDPSINHKGQLSGEDTKRVIGIYLREVNKLKGEEKLVTREDLNLAYKNFKKIVLLYSQSQIGYLTTKEYSSPKDKSVALYMTNEITRLEREVILDI